MSKICFQLIVFDILNHNNLFINESMFNRTKFKVIKNISVAFAITYR